MTRFYEQKKFLIPLAIVILLLAIRTVLPFAVQRYVNRTLDRHPDYDGRIGDIEQDKNGNDRRNENGNENNEKNGKNNTGKNKK